MAGVSDCAMFMVMQEGYVGHDCVPSSEKKREGYGERGNHLLAREKATEAHWAALVPAA